MRSMKVSSVHLLPSRYHKRYSRNSGINCRESEEAIPEVTTKLSSVSSHGGVRLVRGVCITLNRHDIYRLRCLCFTPAFAKISCLPNVARDSFNPPRLTFLTWPGVFCSMTSLSPLEMMWHQVVFFCVKGIYDVCVKGIYDVENVIVDGAVGNIMVPKEHQSR